MFGVPWKCALHGRLAHCSQRGGHYGFSHLINDETEARADEKLPQVERWVPLHLWVGLSRGRDLQVAKPPRGGWGGQALSFEGRGIE